MTNKIVAVFVCGFLSACGSDQAESPGAPAYELSVERVRGEIFNPWTLEMDQVELRAYRGEGQVAFGAPTMRVRPGEVLRLGVQNNLPECTDEEIVRHECFNATNIHTHGLWVSPGGNSDNVNISINPGSRFDFEFAIPPEHPAGTFWYHPHIHGSTTIQLGSGMAGALIIEGDRVPTAETPGDIDILLLDDNARPLPEHILMIGQIQYACFNDEGRPRGWEALTRETPFSEIPPWTCGEDEIGTVDRLSQIGTFREMMAGRVLTLNGLVQPRLEGFEAGRFERLRVVHAGLRRNARMTVRRLAGDAPALEETPRAEHALWIEQYCTGEPQELFQFADDGLTRGQMRQIHRADLYPGARMDILVRFDEPGDYCLLNDQTDPRQPQDYRILALLEVGGETVPEDDARAALTELLVNGANRAIDNPDVRASVISDLQDGLRLSHFEWHEPVTDEELTGYQTAVMSIVENEGGATLSIDGQPFDHRRIDRVLTLGAVEEWEVTANLGRHPFHIHVNPFQVISIVNENGEDVTDPTTEAFDAEYAGMIGGWRDTIIVKRDYTIRLRTRYRRFIGDFFVHCHFASHGDEGMMQYVRVALPGTEHHEVPMGQH